MEDMVGYSIITYLYVVPWYRLFTCPAVVAVAFVLIKQIKKTSVV